MMMILIVRAPPGFGRSRNRDAKTLLFAYLLDHGNVENNIDDNIHDNIDNNIGARGGCAARPPKRDRFLLAPAHAPVGGAGVRARGGGGGPAARRRRRTRGRSPAGLCVCQGAPVHRTRKPKENAKTRKCEKTDMACQGPSWPARARQEPPERLDP